MHHYDVLSLSRSRVSSVVGHCLLVNEDRDVALSLSMRVPLRYSRLPMSGNVPSSSACSVLEDLRCTPSVTPPAAFGILNTARDDGCALICDAMISGSPWYTWPSTPSKNLQAISDIEAVAIAVSPTSLLHRERRHVDRYAPFTGAVRETRYPTARARRDAAAACAWEERRAVIVVVVATAASTRKALLGWRRRPERKAAAEHGRHLVRVLVAQTAGVAVAARWISERAVARQALLFLETREHAAALLAIATAMGVATAMRQCALASEERVLRLSKRLLRLHDRRVHARDQVHRDVSKHDFIQHIQQPNDAPTAHERTLPRAT